MNNHVVARFADGRIVKGTSLDVDPKRPMFHVRTPDGEMIDVAMADLKALFFVRSLSGDSAKTDATEIAPTDPRMRGAPSGTHASPCNPCAQMPAVSGGLKASGYQRLGNDAVVAGNL